MELMGLTFRQPWWLLVGLAVAVIVVVIHLWTLKGQRSNTLRHAEAAQLENLGLLPPSWLKQHGGVMALAFAVLFLAAQLAQPYRVELRAQSERADVAFAIDGSSSMQAIEPGCGVRFECAKQLVTDALEAVPAGDSTSLMSFADGATVLIPPTLDREVVRFTLGRLEPQGSTDLEAVIQATLATTSEARARHLVIVSDGNVNASLVGRAMEEAQAAGLHVSAVLVGSSEGYLEVGSNQHQGVPVFPLKMQAIADAGDGAYAEGTVPDMAQLIESLERETVYERQEVPWPYFGFVAGLMLLLGLTGLFWRTRRSVS